MRCRRIKYDGLACYAFSIAYGVIDFTGRRERAKTNNKRYFFCLLTTNVVLIIASISLYHMNIFIYKS